MLVATGTKVIAAARRKPTKPRIAPNANAKIAKPTSKSARKRVANAVHQIGKATRTATTKTITVHATGMVGTAAVKKMSTSIAKNANAWTLINKNAMQSAAHQVGPTTVSATTTTTTAVVGGTKVTAAATLAKHLSASSAKNASVWIRTALTSRRMFVSASVVTRTGQAMAFATVATIIADANMTKVIVAANQAIQINTNFARKTANA